MHHNSVKVDDAIRFKSGEFINISGLNAIDDPSGFELTFFAKQEPSFFGFCRKNHWIVGSISRNN